jgi:hypothetical protein
MKKQPKPMQRVGDMKELRKLVAKAKPMTPADEKFLEAVLKIRDNPDAAEAAFMARQLIQCTLPHANPGPVPVWKRRNGNLVLSIKSGTDAEGVSIGYPFGVIPRLLLFWIVTEALRNKKRCLETGENPRRLELGHNLAKFMREVGLDPNTGGGKRGDAPRLRDQMRRLFRSIISFDQAIEEAHRHGERWLDMQVAPKGELWWDPKQPTQDTLWGSWIELSEDFYKAITAVTVPVDLRALRALKRSPLALDLYALLAFKVFAANQKSEAQFIDWPGLMLQLGCNYDAKRIDRFKDKVKKTLRKNMFLWIVPVSCASWDASPPIWTTWLEVWFYHLKC